MLTMLMLAAAAQAATPVAFAPAPATPGRTMIREIVIHDHPDAKTIVKDGEATPERRETIIVVREGKEGTTATTDGPDRRVRVVDVTPSRGEQRREIRIRREPGAPGTRIGMLSCDDGAKVDSEATDKDGKKTA